MGNFVSGFNLWFDGYRFSLAVEFFAGACAEYQRFDNNQENSNFSSELSGNENFR
ncbi:hypothetical protein GARC_4365 [Paraglaciecola arctica BSs20135]|uniref:Uncharacterized protein n=1 Tax=Paraglaciecola arctica BSs20135 TaxID=493475 RepID=K6YT38_9ALTE|nr:hypothetical protein GARC_4365 [Paraglaciecola arctica BSs20135]